MLCDTPQNFGTVNFAHDDVLATHTGHRIGQPPAVAMELRQCVQVDIAVVDTQMPAHGGGIDPQIAVG